MDAQHEVLTLREAAALLRVTVRTAQRMCQRGQLPYFRAGNRYRFYRRDLLALTEPKSEPKQEGDLRD